MKKYIVKPVRTLSMGQDIENSGNARRTFEVSKSKCSSMYWKSIINEL